MRSIFAVVFLFAHARCYDQKPTVNFTRLPDDTEPIGYELFIEPNFGAITPSFAGRVNISISAKTATDEITLNSRDLIVYEIGLTDDNTNSDIAIDSWKYAHHQEQVKIKTNRHILEKQKCTIRIRYSGYLKNDVSDVFHSSYNSYSEVKERLAANIQLYPMHARSAFPCYDEAHFKTPFNISIKIKRNKEIAFSNMPVLDTTDIDEPGVYKPTKYNHWTFVNFIQTPPISTSTVKIFVGELEQLDKFRQNLTDVNGLYLDKYITEGNPNNPKTIRNDGFAAAAINALSAEINKNESTVAPEATDSSTTSYSATTETTEATTASVTTDSSTTSYSTTMEITEPATDPVTTNSSSTEPATSTTQNSTEIELTSISEPFESTTDYIKTTYNYPEMTKTIIFILNETSSFERFYNHPYFLYNLIYISVLIIFGLTISIVFLFVKPKLTN